MIFCMTMDEDITWLDYGAVLNRAGEWKKGNICRLGKYLGIPVPVVSVSIRVRYLIILSPLKSSCHPLRVSSVSGVANDIDNTRTMERPHLAFEPDHPLQLILSASSIVDKAFHLSRNGPRGMEGDK